MEQGRRPSRLDLATSLWNESLGPAGVDATGSFLGLQEFLVVVEFLKDMAEVMVLIFEQDIMLDDLVLAPVIDLMLGVPDSLPIPLLFGGRRVSQEVERQLHRPWRFGEMPTLPSHGCVVILDQDFQGFDEGLLQQAAVPVGLCKPLRRPRMIEVILVLLPFAEKLELPGPLFRRQARA